MDRKRAPAESAGEVRDVAFPGSLGGLATIEPMHGNQVVWHPVEYPQQAQPGIESWYEHIVVDDTLAEGHALACADFLGTKRLQQIVAGWRMPDKNKKVGIKLYSPLEEYPYEKWKSFTIDDNQMACEDLKVADLDGDGRPDIIASGRATHNLVVYWNRTAKK